MKKYNYYEEQEIDETEMKSVMACKFVVGLFVTSVAAILGTVAILLYFM